MGLTNIILAGVAINLAFVEASAPRLRPRQKCHMFGLNCRSGAMIKNDIKNWTDLADTEFINNRWRLVVPYVIWPRYSDVSDSDWRRMESPGPKPANEQEWISRIRPQIEEAVKLYEPTNVLFREYSKTDIDNGLFASKQYVRISDFYSKSSSGCASDVGPNDNSDHIETDIERCRENQGRGDYHPGIIAHELMHILGFMHEHQRPDRDTYLKVDLNRPEAKADPFNYYINREGEILTDYDPESITHYGVDRVIEINSDHPKSVDMKLIGQREKLSSLDVQQINANYPLTVSNKVDFLLELVGGLEKRLAERDQEYQVKLTQIVAQSSKIKKLERQLVKNDEDDKVREAQVQIEQKVVQNEKDNQAMLTEVVAQSNKIERLEKLLAKIEEDDKVRQAEVQATVAAQSKRIERLEKVNANLEQTLAQNEKHGQDRLAKVVAQSDKIEGLELAMKNGDPFIVTTCGQEGNTGPSLTKCIQHYKTNPTYNMWIGSLQEFLTMDKNYPGIQLWKVPRTGTYNIQAHGADAKNRQGGSGARIGGNFFLTADQTIKILVGQRPYPYDRYNGGGAGGTFVVLSVHGSNDDLLLAAGGGGGGHLTSDDDERGKRIRDASLSESGQHSSNGNGGGQKGGPGDSPLATGGAGFLVSSQNSRYSAGAKSFKDGGKGGYRNKNGGYKYGGFGGGGGHGDSHGAGGGGYSGGGGSSKSPFQGGGGGSYVHHSATNVQKSVGHVGQGQVIIRLVD